MINTLKRTISDMNERGRGRDILDKAFFNPDK
jgi:hypothetical protein